MRYKDLSLGKQRWGGGCIVYCSAHVHVVKSWSLYSFIGLKDAFNAKDAFNYHYQNLHFCCHPTIVIKKKINRFHLEKITSMASSWHWCWYYFTLTPSLIQAQLGCLPLQDFALQQDLNKIFRASLRVARCKLNMQSLKLSSFNLNFSIYELEVSVLFSLQSSNDKFIVKQVDEVSKYFCICVLNL